MDKDYCGIDHNHPILEPEDNSLYHPQCDPRELESTCPACKALMNDWRAQTAEMIRMGI